MTSKTFIALVAMLLGSLGPPAARASDLEAEGDLRLETGQAELARAFFKAAIQRDPLNEQLWRKYDQAFEAHLRRVFGVPEAGRGTASGDPGAPAVAGPGPGPGPWSAGPAVGAGPGPGPGAGPAEHPDAHARPPDPGWGVGVDATVSPPAPPASAPPPEPAPPLAPAPAGPLARSPDEIIYVDRTIRAGDTLPVASKEEGQPVTVRTAFYEISDIRFFVDRSGTLHVTGKVKNLSDRDFRNPRLFVHLYDVNLVQWALKYGSMKYNPAVLFRGRTGEFDIPLPGFRNTVGAYRMYLNF